MHPLLDPKNDYVFKRLLADEPALLLALINAVRRRAPPISALEVRNPAIDPDELRGKYIVLDILAEDERGGMHNVEMQVRRLRAQSARSTYYLSKLISGQLVAGQAYERLCPAIGIHLLDYDLFRAPDHAQQALWCFEMRDADTPSVRLGEELQLNLVELRKADRLASLPPALRAWITLFEHWQEEQRMSQITDEPVRRAYDKLKTLSQDEEARRLAFVRERALHDEATLLLEAREDGLEEGRKEGLQDGRQAAMREAAANMIYRTALDDAAIAAITGLDAEIIAELRQRD
jgi:predicted transposase/invertase (TIGR01784 family)